MGRRLSLRSLVLVVALSACGAPDDVIVVASKDFSESKLLGEIIAQQLEDTGFEVERRFPYGNSEACHQALLAGTIDLYVEYTGTAYAWHLSRSGEEDPDRIFDIVRSVYRDSLGVEWLGRLGFNNTFAMLVRAEDARELEIETLSQLAARDPSWRLGAAEEFFGRADGYPGLISTYDLRFVQIDTMPLDSSYIKLVQDSVDIIAGNSTDGWIEPLFLQQLADDRHHFPWYEAAPVVRRAVLETHSGLRTAIEALAGAIDEEQMRQLNYLIELERRDIADVARFYLDSMTRAAGLSEPGAP